MADKPPKKGRTWSEEIVVAGSDLVARVKQLAAAGNVRRLIIKKPAGDVLLEIPLATGVIAGGALIALAPVFAAIGALAALVAEVRLEVVREQEKDEE